MGKSDYYSKGDYNCLCDICGFKFKSSNLRRRWDGYMVCPKDFEYRHPQDYVRGVKDTQNLPWTRPEPPDTFTS
jgi:hypothetical protein